MERIPPSFDQQQISLDEVKPSFSLAGFLLVMLAVLLGTSIAVYILPIWMPNLSSSMNGADPKFYWYLARGSAFTAYLLLWLSMVLGVGITNKLAALWPGLPPTIDLHQYTSILGLAFVLFHGLILLGDHYINFQFAQILIPFAATSYKPLAVGFGQLGLYLWVILVISFYIRRRIGSKIWRGIHYLGFFMFIIALFHGITSGTDSSAQWVKVTYWSTSTILLGLTIFRIIKSLVKTSKKKQAIESQKISITTK